LGSRPVSRTPHFFLHALHLTEQAKPCLSAVAATVAADASSSSANAAAAAKNESHPDKLSTGGPAQAEVLVDDLLADISPSGFSDGMGAQGWRLGLVLPKKQARRSVTRSLIRHQAREALRRHVPAVLADARRQGIDGWVVRLRAPFDRQQFRSAASDALKALVREELDALWRGLDLCSPGARSPRSGKGRPSSTGSSTVYKASATPGPRGAA
jgi:ribonuclease P protein component